MEDNQERDAKALREDYQILKDCINGMYQEYRATLTRIDDLQGIIFGILVRIITVLSSLCELDLNLSKVGTDKWGTASFQGIQITG